jgi:transposase
MKTWLEGRARAGFREIRPCRGDRYALCHRTELGLFLEDGRVDTNTIERTIGPILLGAKNHLFAGSDGGAESWAVTASLIQTVKLNSVEPFTYLREILRKVYHTGRGCPGGNC